jgi:putative toxin-antitoxin system antitoxin component (TIGR02293 family)
MDNCHEWPQEIRTMPAAATIAPAYPTGDQKGVLPMSIAAESAGDVHRHLEGRVYALCLRYLGGKRFWRRDLSSKADVHSAIVKGVPYASLIFLVEHVTDVVEEDVAKVLGISTRTLRRQTEAPDKQMPADLASKAWLFAETLAKATEVFGGKEAAEQWLSRPAGGLSGQRPIDLLQTVQGAELVDDFLTRLEYGVYT